LLKWLLSHFPTAHSILEAGCGTGHFTRWFEKEGMHVSGLDLSRSMLKAAKGFGSRLLIQGDAANLPFAPNSFDIIAMITTLEFLPDPISALIEGRRIARQGFILGVINKHGLVGMKYKRNGGPIWEAAQFYSPTELKKMLRKTFDSQAAFSWRTTLWPLIPWYLPLPWGGFIGMAIKWKK